MYSLWTYWLLCLAIVNKYDIQSHLLLGLFLPYPIYYIMLKQNFFNDIIFKNHTTVIKKTNLSSITLKENSHILRLNYNVFIHF